MPVNWFVNKATDKYTTSCHCWWVYLSNHVVDDFLGRQVTLITDQKPVDMLACIALDLLQPLLYVVERLLLTRTIIITIQLYFVIQWQQKGKKQQKNKQEAKTKYKYSQIKSFSSRLAKPETAP